MTQVAEPYTTAHFEDADAPGAKPLSDILPGMPCRQCGGNLIRLDGELSCGRCGWPAGRELPRQSNLTISKDSQLSETQARLSRAEAENAALKERVKQLESVNEAPKTQEKPAKKQK